MRELKLRAWDINDKWMDDDFYISSKGDVLDRPNITYDTPNIEIEHVCNLVVMQFTGLQDKKGVDIYEGDIIEWVSTNTGACTDKHVDTMEWSDDCACFFLMPWIHEPHAAEMTVIGNIYENPELLESKNVK